MVANHKKSNKSPSYKSSWAGFLISGNKSTLEKALEAAEKRLSQISSDRPDQFSEDLVKNELAHLVDKISTKFKDQFKSIWQASKGGWVNKKLIDR